MTDIRARLPGNFNIRAQTLQTLQRSAVTDLAGGCLGLVDVLRWGEVRLRGEIMELELEVQHSPHTSILNYHRADTVIVGRGERSNSDVTTMVILNRWLLWT